MVNIRSSIICLTLCAPLLLWNTVSSQSLTDPCGGPTPVPGSSNTMTTRNLSQAMEFIVSSAVEAKTVSGLLKNKYTGSSTPRISPTYAEDLKDIRVTNVPVHRRAFNDSEITVAIQSDYDDVSTIITFLKYIHKYETEYTLDMETFQHKLNNTLCKIKIAADANGQNLTYTITDDVVTRKVFISDAARYARDYIVFRDAEAFLSSVSDPYVY